MFKKSIVTITNCLTILILAGCFGVTAACGQRATRAAVAEKGFVKGSVKNAAGNPLKGVKIIIDHSLFYNSNITAATDEQGNYRIKIPNGSWYAYAQFKKTYNNKNYTFYLEPDSYEGFGGEGAVRNFVWKLTGKKQEPLSPGFFGGTITFDKDVDGAYIDRKEIEFTLTPMGNLIDGSAGETLTLRSADGYKLEDVPIGRYDISASYKGRAVELRKWNTSDTYVKTMQLDFEPQISPHCDNCAKLEYKY
jgi:hypothetical protein